MMAKLFIGLFIGLYCMLGVVVLAKLSAYDRLANTIPFSMISFVAVPLLLVCLWYVWGHKKLKEMVSECGWFLKLKVWVMYFAFFFRNYPSIVEEYVKALPPDVSAKTTKNAANESTEEWSAAFA